MHHSINTVLSWFVFSIHTLPNVNLARDLNGLPRTLPTRLRVGSFGFSRPSVSRAACRLNSIKAGHASPAAHAAGIRRGQNGRRLEGWLDWTDPDRPVHLIVGSSKIAEVDLAAVVVRGSRCHLDRQS